MSFSGMIGKLFGKASEQPADGPQVDADSMREAVAKLPRPEVLALRAWLARPDWPDRVLAQHVISYLLTGQPVDVLEELEDGRGKIEDYLSGLLNRDSPSVGP